MNGTSEPGGGVRAQLQQLTEPLRAQLKEIEQRIEAVSGELETLRDARRDIEFVLKRLDPQMAVKKKQTSRPRSPSRIDEVLAYLESSNGAFGDDFNYTNVFKAMRAEGVPIGKEMVRTAFIELHERGVLRMTRTTSGGGRAYALVGHA